MNSSRITSLGFAAVLFGCGNVDPSPDASASREAQGETAWQPVTDQAYPFTNAEGATVCAEWERWEAGKRFVRSEFYHLDVMNEHLAGSGSLDARVIVAMEREGLARVTTCDDARRFIAIQRDAVEAGAASGAPAAPPVLDGEAAGESIDKVANGVNNSNPAVVRVQPFNSNTGVFGTCSGMVISPNALLTAAQCFFANGNWNIRVDHGRGPSGGPGASVDCITDVGNCSNPPVAPPNAVVTRVSGFSGAGDSARDLAVVVFNTPFRPPFGMMRFSASPVPAGDTYFVNGYGAHADSGSGLGIHRQANSAQGIDTAFTGYWRDSVQSGVGRPCGGDAGSPAINTTHLNGSPGGQGNNMAIGLANNMDNSNGGFCPEPGDFFRYTRIEDKLPLIQSKVPSCIFDIFNGWTFVKCF